MTTAGFVAPDQQSYPRTVGTLRWGWLPTFEPIEIKTFVAF
ncbi:hypothetical protein ACQPXM_11715 [Kribbella sp. CA-253562]